MIALAVLLIVGAAALAGLLALRVDTREPVLVAARSITVGSQITRDDLATQRVAADGLATIPAGQSGLIVGQYAAQSIPAGRLLDKPMFTATGFLSPDKVAVGVSLAAGRMPASGLSSGDRVQVILLADIKGTVLVPSAVVSSTSGGGSSTSGSLLGGGSSSSSSADSVATLIVSPSEAAPLAAAAAANKVAIVLVSRAGQVAN